jgi:hypothetical protein
MILFHCWFCNRMFLEPPKRAGARFRCSCGRRVKVPKRSGGSSKIVAGADRLIEALVYGALCAAFALGFSFSAVSRSALFRANFTPLLVVTGGGFLVGALFGERALNYFGRKVRDRESNR